MAVTTKLDLVTGFLGAGKTRFIQHYTEYLREQGQTFALVENEFGAEGVDRATLETSCDEIYELAGGCICCSLTPMFSELVLSLAGQYDRIIIEPSGIFDLGAYQSILDRVTENGTGEEGMHLVVVDPHTFDDLDDVSLDVLRSELQGDPLVLFSKTDLPGEYDKDRIGAALKTLSQNPELEIAAKGSLEFADDDFAALQNRIELRRDVARGVRERSCLNHAELFSSPSVKFDRDFTYEEIHSLMHDLLDDPKTDNIVRVKGSVPATGGGFWSVNCTMRQCIIEGSNDGNPMLYFIMSGRPTADFRLRLNDLLAQKDAAR